MPTIRPATAADLSGILDIYNHAVLHTTASYDLEPVSLQSRQEWFTARQKAGFPVLVAEGASGEVLGFASYGTFREKPGYNGTVEHSVYIREGQRGAGLGLALMERLIAEARQQGLHVMLGSVDADNAGSIAFHTRLGFRQVAHFHQVGRKFGRWLDMVFMELLLEDEQ
ncbi:MAG: GNAT family N-acetyltransferase [Deinococcus sp.]|uniref:GNAT family N-acetyltransferase n=1 Tax=Deinococcus sp. TaxID=47478 RepID=UPI0026DAD1A3|nr:GNAT family N-acetyltransferase [Deinococcus sp.]MDO4246311.1 GNAT family N-acetyltransferase [Deinococcus sp.]